MWACSVMMRFAIFFLIALFCSENIAEAQELRAIPVKIQGNFAAPDCGRYSDALILTKYFYLKSTRKDMRFGKIALQSEQSDHWTVVYDGIPHPTRLEDDGILKIATILGKGAKEWDNLAVDSVQEYTGCIDAPTLVPRMMERLTRYIDRIREQCTVSLENDCARVLFKLADADANQKITPSEIKRAVAIALLLARLADGKDLPDVESEKIIAQSKTEGALIADQILAKQDADKSGSIDYNEIAENFSAPQSRVIKPTLISIGKLIPAFGIAAKTVD